MKRVAHQKDECSLSARSQEQESKRAREQESKGGQKMDIPAESLII